MWPPGLDVLRREKNAPYQRYVGWVQIQVGYPDELGRFADIGQLTE
jgi:hypothetical protein